MPGPSNPKRVVWIIAVIFLGVLPSSAQQTDELQKQLEQLKQQYEQTTREFQERIAALEQQLKKESEAKQNATKKEGDCVGSRGGYTSCPGTVRSEADTSGTAAFRANV